MALLQNDLRVKQAIDKLKPKLPKLKAGNNRRVEILASLVRQASVLANSQAEEALKSALTAAHNYGRVVGEQAGWLDVFVKDYIKKKIVKDITKLELIVKGLNEQATGYCNHYKGYKALLQKLTAKQVEAYPYKVREGIDWLADEAEPFDAWRRDIDATRQAIRLYVTTLTPK
jgi:hypothetical protein